MHIDKQILFKRIKILFLPCTLLAALAAFFYLLFVHTVHCANTLFTLTLTLTLTTTLTTPSFVTLNTHWLELNSRAF